MQTLSDIALKIRRPKGWMHALHWIVEQNANYRASHKLRSMADERLKDMGISREDADTAFYKRFALRDD